MGILDFNLSDALNSDQGRLGLGLLAAAGPSMTPMGFGQRLQQAMQGIDAQKKNQLEMELLKSHAAQYAADAEAKKLKGIQDERLQRMLEQDFAPRTAEQALSAGAATGSIGPTNENANRMQGGFANMTPERLAMYKANGKDFVDIYKLGMPDWKNNNGYWFDASAPNFKGGFLPGMQTSSSGQTSMTTIGNDGIPMISAPQGALNTYGAYQNADQRAKAAWTPSSYTPAGESNPIQSTVANDVERINNQSLQNRPPLQNMGNANLSPEVLQLIQKDAAAYGGNPKINLNAPQAGQTLGLKKQYPPNALQSNSELEAQVGGAKSVNKARDAINESWLKKSYEPVLSSGDSASSAIESAKISRDALQKIGGTGWGTEMKAGAASILNGLGVAPASVSLYASNAEVFQKIAMDRLLQKQIEQAGTQTEGDAKRMSQTYASLKNTTRANDFIIDLAQANAEMDKAKARFYANAIPIARDRGDLTEIDREWKQKRPSIFSLPIMQKWNVK